MDDINKVSRKAPISHYAPTFPTNSKTGIFGIFPKEERKFVAFKTGILGGPALKVTTKLGLKLHDGNQLDFHRAALVIVNCKAVTIEFVQLIKMSQFRPLSSNNERVC